MEVKYPFCVPASFTVFKVLVQKYFLSFFLTCTVRHCLTLGPATVLFCIFLETLYCHCGNDMPKLSLPFYELGSLRTPLFPISICSTIWSSIMQQCVFKFIYKALHYVKQKENVKILNF